MNKQELIDNLRNLSAKAYNDEGRYPVGSNTGDIAMATDELTKDMSPGDVLTLCVDIAAGSGRKGYLLFIDVIRSHAQLRHRFDPARQLADRAQKIMHDVTYW